MSKFHLLVFSIFLDSDIDFSAVTIRGTKQQQTTSNGFDDSSATSES